VGARVVPPASDKYGQLNASWGQHWPRRDRHGGPPDKGAPFSVHGGPSSVQSAPSSGSAAPRSSGPRSLGHLPRRSPHKALPRAHLQPGSTTSFPDHHVYGNHVTTGATVARLKRRSALSWLRALTMHTSRGDAARGRRRGNVLTRRGWIGGSSREIGVSYWGRRGVVTRGHERSLSRLRKTGHQRANAGRCDDVATRGAGLRWASFELSAASRSAL
jgi:hypothetical protein